MPNYKKFAIAQLLLNAVMALAGITFGRAYVLVASVFAGVAIGLFAMSLITIGQFIGNAVEHMDCGREQKASFVIDMSFVAVCQLVVALAIAYDLAVHIGIARQGQRRVETAVGRDRTGMKGKLDRLKQPEEVRGRNRDATTADLWEALARLQRTEVTPTIAALAREVGVTPALIHNRYAEIAREVRRLSGRDPGASEDGLNVTLKREQETARDLRAENLDLRHQLQAMASVNEALRQELKLQHVAGDAKVVSFVPKGSKR